MRVAIVAGLLASALPGCGGEEHHGGAADGGTGAATAVEGGTGGDAAGGRPAAAGGRSAGGRDGAGGIDQSGGRSGAGTGGTAGGAPGGSGSGGDLPEGDAGIAAAHPGDVGIADNPAVVFADDYEGYTDASGLEDRWDAVYQRDQVRIAVEPSHVASGAQALEFTVPQQSAELSNATDKVLAEEQDVLFLRYYSKFEAPFDVVGSSHNGSMISAHYFVGGQATPGVRADGTNKFLANLENWRGEEETLSPGPLNVYLYHPEQRSDYGDHFYPTGLVMPNTSIPFEYGPGFVAREDVTPELDRWYCYEYMVRANTPGQRDGRIAFWLDGKLLADFPGLRLRDVASLKIDRFGLSLHVGSNTRGVARKWYDDVVAATSYIGPRAD